MAIRLLAIATGQKVGQAKMDAQHCERGDDRTTLGAGLVDRGADRRLDREPEQAADRRHQSDLGLAPMLLSDQEHIEVMVAVDPTFDAMATASR